MRFPVRAVVLACLGLASAVSFSPAAEPSRTPLAQDRVVVMVSIDALANFYFDDPKAEMPVIRQLAADGARAKMVKASMPTVTWPNHTTLVTGVNPAKHGVVGNSFFDRTKKETVPLLPDPLFDKDEIVKVPTVYDAAHQAGLRTASILWPASRGAKSLDWTVPDVKTDELFQKYGSPALFAACKAAGVPYEQHGENCRKGLGEERDKLDLRMFQVTLRDYKPQFALLHLIELDHVQHLHGPQSPEAYAALKFEDGLIGEVRADLEKQFPGNWTLLIVSDHGFFPYRQFIQPNVLLRREGSVQTQGTKITDGTVRTVAQGGSSFIYILDDARREALREKLAKDFAAVEGVGVVITPKDFPAYGIADPKDDPHAPDLVLSARSGYCFNDLLTSDLLVTPPAEQTKGAHGYDPNEPALHASFIAGGTGIKKGVTLGTVSNTSVAPTVAALLGVALPTADGPVLDEVLAK